MIREEGTPRGGADERKHVARLHVVAAETAGGGKVSLHIGHIVVIPKPLHCLARQIDGRLPVLGFKNIETKLLRADNHVIGHRVPAKERLAVVRHVRQAVCPLVVALRHRGHALDGRKLVGARARCLREHPPVRIVDHEQLRRLRHREYLDAAVVPEIALAQVAFDVFLSVLLRQIRAEICDTPQAVHRVGRIRIGGKDIRHFLCADLALHRVHHVLLQIVDRSKA